MSFREFMQQMTFSPRSEHLRRGQHLVNELSRVRPDLGRQMTADKDFDCFYDDKRIPAFWTWVEANWSTS